MRNCYSKRSKSSAKNKAMQHAGNPCHTRTSTKRDKRRARELRKKSEQASTNA